MLSDRIPTPDVEKFGLRSQCNQWNDWEQVCRNKQAQDRKARLSVRKQPGGWILQANTGQNKVYTVEETNSDSDELF